MRLDGALRRGDRLTVTVSQPLRVAHATADLTVPTALGPDGSIATRSERIDLRPSSLEVDLELAYDRSLGAATMGTFFGVSRQPDHLAAAAPAAAAGVRMRLGW